MVPELGARFTMRPEDGPPVTCEVVEIDEKRRRLRLAWIIDEKEQATSVRFELVETTTGTVLKVCHNRLRGGACGRERGRPAAAPCGCRAAPPSSAPAATGRGLQWAA